MSKRANKIDAVEERRRDLRVKIQRLFEMAAEWAKEAFGQRIRRGAILEAVSKYKRQGYVVDWMRRWLNVKPMIHA